MNDTEFHKLLDKTHILGITVMYNNYLQMIYDWKTMTQTPEVLEKTAELRKRCQIMEQRFERDIVKIIKNHSSPKKELENETQY